MMHPTTLAIACSHFPFIPTTSQHLGLDTVGLKPGPLSQLDFERLSVARPLVMGRKHSWSQCSQLRMAGPLVALVGDVLVSHPGPVWLRNVGWGGSPELLCPSSLGHKEQWAASSHGQTRQGLYGWNLTQGQDEQNVICRFGVLIG